MPTISPNQQADIDEYNQRQAAIAASVRPPIAYTPITDQDIWDGRMDDFSVNALQPLRDAEIQQKESALAKLDPEAKKAYDAQVLQIQVKAEADKATALDAALETKAEAEVEADGIKSDDPTFLSRVQDILSAASKAIFGG